MQKCLDAGCDNSYAELVALRYLNYRINNEEDTRYSLPYFIDYTMQWDMARGVVIYDKKTEKYKQVK